MKNTEELKNEKVKTIEHEGKTLKVNLPNEWEVTFFEEESDQTPTWLIRDPEHKINLILIIYNKQGWEIINTLQSQVQHNYHPAAQTLFVTKKAKYTGNFYGGHFQ